MKTKKKASIEFTKMHGLGNDYVMINCIRRKINNPHQLAKKISDRHFGVGSDGMILIKNSDRADFKMEMYNSDGSSAENCGNGLRCTAKYVYDKRMMQEKNFKIDTKAGVFDVKLLQDKKGEIKNIEVDMGVPVLIRKDIPILGDNEFCISEDLLLEEGVRFKITGLSLGNPHIVIFTESVDNFPVQKYGPLIENHYIFPNRTNVEFVEVQGKKLRQRTWERGNGETLACGSGACAAVVASVLNNIGNRKSEVILNGGSLFIQWGKKTGHVIMKGPAVEVFNGNYYL
jgi:diaminopimelate epimerase